MLFSSSAQQTNKNSPRPYGDPFATYKPVDEAQENMYYKDETLSSEIVQKLKQSIENALQKLNIDTALFFSELYYSICGGLSLFNIRRIESIYLYILSLYLNDDYIAASDIAEKYQQVHISINFIYAKCALKLNQNEEKACFAILKRLHDYPTDFPNDFLFMADKATIHNILGKLYDRLSATKSSMDHQLEALKLDPYLWEVYESLFNKKSDIDLKQFFFNNVANSGSNIDDKTINNSRRNSFNKSNRIEKNNSRSSNGESKAPRTGRSNSTRFRTNVPVESMLINGNNNTLATSPTVNKATVSSLAKMNTKPRSIKTTPSKQITFEQRMNFTTPNNASVRDANLRNTERRNLNMKNSTNLAGGDGYNEAYMRETLEGEMIPRIKRTSSPTHNEIAQARQFDNLFYTFVKILKLTSEYNCHAAIRTIDTELPPYVIENMPWCLAQFGKLHYEISNYSMSSKFFVELRKLQPNRIKDLEIYSTLLWHLREKSALYSLSSQLVSKFPNKPETWCVTGNYFSLIKNHAESIKAFSRSTELNSKFAYAYTLQGHEYTANESFETAKEFYRKAIACDPHHYNAYYGLGDCASRLGKYEEALIYFEKARLINPINVILICCCGHALEKIGRYNQAVSYYGIASKLQSDSTLPKYRIAQLYFNVGRFNLALEIFNELVEINPEEATIHFMLGQIYQTMGLKKDAIAAYSKAMSLDPQGNHVIEEALEKCHYQE
ncbi:anaphase-promoting complex subunit Cdc27p [Monosporozyma unispora]